MRSGAIFERYREIQPFTLDLVPLVVVMNNHVVCYTTWHNLILFHTSLAVKASSSSSGQ